MTTVDPSRATWRKSSHSGANGSCIEVCCPAPDTVAVRDSKDPGGTSLVFTGGQWQAFIGSLKRARLLRLNRYRRMAPPILNTADAAPSWAAAAYS
jgi:hypothetical protein